MKKFDLKKNIKMNEIFFQKEIKYKLNYMEELFNYTHHFYFFCMQ